MSRGWTIVVVAAVALAASVALDAALGASSPGLVAATGFLGCVVLILGAKWLGKVWLRRDEDYWQRVSARRAALGSADGPSGGDSDEPGQSGGERGGRGGRGGRGATPRGGAT